MQEVSGSIPLFSTKKALYFVGSTVLFFLLKLVFGGCIASPAPFLGFCRRFLYNPQLLTLRCVPTLEVPFFHKLPQTGAGADGSFFAFTVRLPEPDIVQQFVSVVVESLPISEHDKEYFYRDEKSTGKHYNIREPTAPKEKL